MVVRTIEMLLEYVCLIICLHKMSKNKIKFDLVVISIGFFEWIIVQAMAFGILAQSFKFLIHVCLLVYTRKKLVDGWVKATRVYGIMLIVLMTLQIVGYYLLRIFSSKVIGYEYRGIIINVFICVLISAWRDKYNEKIIQKINKYKYGIIILIFLLILFRILQLYIQNDFIDMEIALQFVLETIGICIASVLWMKSENDNKIKSRELQMYELYNKAFEEAVVTMRIRQHEFDNHINTIKCMRYVIRDEEELAYVQAEYCNQILKENELSKLLKKDLEPIIIGFLYSKLMLAKTQDIEVDYEIQCRCINRYIAINEMVELLGIIYDNAVEAMVGEGKKKIILRLKEQEKVLSIEIANISRILLNNEIEKLCDYGYSTKSQKRGIGLTRVKEIIMQNKADMLIRNVNYGEDNYLSFYIEIAKRQENC